MIEICEVGPRDGIQNEKVLLTLEEKLTLINKLIDAGARKIEVTSFVNEKVVPQMAQAEALIEHLPNIEDVIYSALILSKSGKERFLHSSISHAQLAFAVSDAFNLKNARRSTAQSIVEMSDIVNELKSADKYVNVIFGTTYGCPYSGDIDLHDVITIARQFIELGVDEITFADTVGLATPNTIEQSIHLFREQFGDFPLGLHLHNTRGLGIANALVGIQHGITRFDSSVGGIGGCPFAPKAVGNICTEDFVYMLHQMGYKSSIDVDEYVKVAQWIEDKLNRKIDGMLMKTY
ncbi:hydroxymethylglutaryl-CoA lyase [Solibacillus kalamii]|uniref:Hydroxymethylglutaryl-CoA lyase n=1 Tax=Solibacillus kalamii TaxID=1748298 RepID=A0ABX3ZFH9_9BACL|nr:hydroxymethylglutaryl-CoA lyase [Solibacillus kalamii]MBM7665976.1 hydroxymethylglutaryl-CoA lyase [Solibacillus kalamii]OUZ38484.1 hydroxymethylglutaryl-CoA lyase [Solibacillus kalamii]